MSNIAIYLTTTKWLVESDDLDYEQLAKLDIPVCTCEMSMQVFGFNPHEEEENEFRWLETCKNMAKYVIIKDRTVYIGDNSDGTLNSGLIEYSQIEESEYNTHFLKRWYETKVLMLEFTIFGKNSKPIGCLKGLWTNDHWKFLNVFGSNSITVI